MFVAAIAERRVARKSAPTIKQLTIDPLSVLRNTKPTMAASVVATNPIHELPLESFLGFLLGDGRSQK